jgi:hypothetical protein
MKSGWKIGLTKVQAMFRETFGLGPGLSLGVLLFISLVTISTVFWFFHSAPPNTLILTSGPAGSIFQKNAEKYGQILARRGIKLKILCLVIPDQIWNLIQYFEAGLLLSRDGTIFFLNVS